MTAALIREQEESKVKGRPRRRPCVWGVREEESEETEAMP